jgi:DNA-binding CsgD family transcriptional regulator
MREKRTYAYPAAPLEIVRKRLVRYALSPREREVLLLLIRGFPNKEIASRCSLSVDTVKEYLKHIYVKIGIHGRTALLAHLFGTDKR